MLSSALFPPLVSCTAELERYAQAGAGVGESLCKVHLDPRCPVGCFLGGSYSRAPDGRRVCVRPAEASRGARAAGALLGMCLVLSISLGAGRY